jgi:hypothetical protein
MTQLKFKYPPSKPCSCNVCRSYCIRPGWWTVEETRKAIVAGYANRMMLELSPQGDFGVLSPAFKGNEGNYALQIFAASGCTFFNDGFCEIYNTGLQPLECRYCHHNRKDKGKECHHDIGLQWNSREGKRLIVQWGNLIGFWQRQGLLLVEK